MLAPAMNSNMLAHDAVRRNLQMLAARGVRFVEPGEGYLACGWIGRGRLAEPDAIVDAACALLSPSDSILRGRHVLVSAGPTYEDIDPVRYLGNRSSGRMGFALAAEARQRGARVTLVSGPTRLAPPTVDEVVRVRSAAEMHEAVMTAATSADVVIMAAAVADFTPASTSPRKVAKADGPLTLTLNRTKDILGDLGARRAAIGAVGPVLVGFAAETDDLVRKAREKRARKGVDMIVANDVALPDRGFDAETNAVTILSDFGDESITLQSKDRVAAAILDRVERLLRTRTSTPAHR
jgi:phosphopantothenoylcysteine decarboxylase/phosphopantothenate--cysteine ligase